MGSSKIEFSALNSKGEGMQGITTVTPAVYKPENYISNEILIFVVASMKHSWYL